MEVNVVGTINVKRGRLRGLTGESRRGEASTAVEGLRPQ